MPTAAITGQSPGVAVKRLIMLNLEKCKKLLEQKGKHYTDEEVKHIRQLLYKVGNLDYFLNSQKKVNANSNYLHKGKY